MLRKVLKYDFKYVWRIWWIMAVAVLGISLVGALALRGVLEELTNTSNDPSATAALTLLLVVFACFAAIIGSSIGTLVMVYSRFHKNFFTDEGYLTFTLPVSRKTLLLSKTINAMIWTVAQYLLLAVCIAMFFLISPPTESGAINLGIFEGIGDLFSMLWGGLGGWTIGYIIVGVIVSIAGALFSTVLIQLCVTLSAMITKKHNVLAAIGIYLGINMLWSMLTNHVGGQVMKVFVGTVDKVFVGVTSEVQIHLIFLSVILLIGAIFATVAIGIWCGTLGLIERKLNLA